MDEKLLRVLEFDEIRKRLANYAVSACAKSLILELAPSTEESEIIRNLRLTQEAYLVKHKYLISPIGEFDDITEIIDKARAGAVLRGGELLKVACVMRCARLAKSEISPLGEDVVGLKQMVGSIVVDRNLETQIGDAIAGENEIKDDASMLLRDIRRKIHAANLRLKEKLASYTRNGSISKYLQDNLVTVRMGRFVLPVKSECRSMVPGLIHDQSGSGSTVFIEPFPVVELNNELRYLQMEEEREIERILAALSDYVANCYDILSHAQDRLTLLDIIFAKSEYSVSFDGTMPMLSRSGETVLLNARHPLIDRDKVVPVGINVGKEYNMLIVTGPNTGGKTVCLKTVGLCCLMAYSGIMIPCDKNSTVGIYDNIFCDLGDEQSIEQSLSTFSAHIVNIVRITNEVTPKSLVLFDELGAGTDPVEGAALSVGILKYLELVGCKGIVTTHFNEVKEYALMSNKLMNACMQFDEETLTPTYRLMIGVPGVSNALKIAGTLGLNDFILSRAKEAITDEQAQFEGVLRQAQYAKTEAERQKEQIEADRKALNEERIQIEILRKKIEEKQEKIFGNAKAETNRLISGIVAKANELIQELKETIQAGDEEALRKAREIRTRLENVHRDNEERICPPCEAFMPAKAKVGQAVVVKSLCSEGILLSTADKKGQYRVRVGNLQISVKSDDLGFPVKLSKEKKMAGMGSARATGSDNGVVAPLSVEIKLLGMTVAEAIEELEPHILAASSGTMLRIVHGKGTGALGKGIQAYLKNCPQIASYRYGRYGEGDTGVTIAEIK